MSERNHQHLLTVLHPFQLEKLERDVSKGDWKKEHINDLVRNLEEEIMELWLELSSGTPESIIRECADIANFAAMIADKVMSEKDGAE
jgi:hypothetical protein